MKGWHRPPPPGAGLSSCQPPSTPSCPESDSHPPPDFLSWSISLPSSCTMQRETPSLEVRSGVGLLTAGHRPDSAVWEPQGEGWGA